LPKKKASETATLRFPVLETKDAKIAPADTISRFLASSGKNAILYGTNLIQTAEVDQWLEYISHEVRPAALIFLNSLLFGDKKPNKGEIKDGTTRLDNILKNLNTHFQHSTFLVGERITIADLSLIASIGKLFELHFDPKQSESVPNVVRWFLTMASQKQVISVIGKQELKKPKKDTYKSTFDLDAWKKTYANEKKRESAIPFLWSNLDRRGNSIWLSTYKYPEECTFIIKTKNLLNGMDQRLQPFSKEAFGLLGILGEETKHNMVCVWIVAGLEVPESFRKSDDYELFDWVKLNEKTDKQKIEDLLARDGKYEGQDWLFTKLF